MRMAAYAAAALLLFGSAQAAWAASPFATASGESFYRLCIATKGDLAAVTTAIAAYQPTPLAKGTSLGKWSYNLGGVAHELTVPAKNSCSIRIANGDTEKLTADIRLATSYYLATSKGEVFPVKMPEHAEVTGPIFAIRREGQKSSDRIRLTIYRQPKPDLKFEIAFRLAAE